MGNWRTVQIAGHMNPAEVDALRDALQIPEPPTVPYSDTSPEWEVYERAVDAVGPASFTRQGSLFGLNDWVGPTIDARGNVGKDVSVEEIFDHLAKLVQVAPSLTVVVDVGGEWESTTCIATITVGDGVVVISDPEVSHVEGAGLGEGMERLVERLGRILNKD